MILAVDNMAAHVNNRPGPGLAVNLRPETVRCCLSSCCGLVATRPASRPVSSSADRHI